MHHRHKKRVFRFALFFAMMLVFAIIEDLFAASLSGDVFLFETVPLIFAVAFVFTIIAELVEEWFGFTDSIIEDAVKNAFSHMEKHKIKPSYENVMKHVKTHRKNSGG
ncbi:hypothetical protein D4Q76_00690 [archaeon]|nr:MAG: hypothetical protein D4Q76_00690 [archaeon]